MISTREDLPDIRIYLIRQPCQRFFHLLLFFISELILESNIVMKNS